MKNLILIILFCFIGQNTQAQNDTIKILTDPTPLLMEYIDSKTIINLLISIKNGDIPANYLEADLSIYESMRFVTREFEEGKYLQISILKDPAPGMEELVMVMFIVYSVTSTGEQILERRCIINLEDRTFIKNGEIEDRDLLPQVITFLTAQKRRQ